MAKENCAAAVDRSRGEDGGRILARRSLFRSLNREMETSAKMKFLLDQIEDVGVRSCGCSRLKILWVKNVFDMPQRIELQRDDQAGDGTCGLLGDHRSLLTK